MMFSDETLMAYADGELDPKTRAAVEEAIAADAQIAQRVAHHTALRNALRFAYAEVLTEPVPDRLVAAARRAPAAANDANVVPRRRKPAARWSWPQWGAIAASLIIGAIGSQLALRTHAVGPVSARNGQLLAAGTLAAALSQQLASAATPSTSVQIGVSFRSNTGDYCRTFVLRDASALAGLACREGEQWRLQVLARGDAQAGSTGQYRPAGSVMPRSILQAVDEQIAGEPLDAGAEAAARSRNWSR